MADIRERLRERAEGIAAAVQRGGFTFREADTVIAQALRETWNEAMDAAAEEVGAAPLGSRYQKVKAIRALKVGTGEGG